MLLCVVRLIGPIYVLNSIAELPLFWAAPEVQGPGADSVSDQIGSAPAPAPGKKGRLPLAPTLAPAPDAKEIVILSSAKVNY